jgi:hypothetical protein
MSVLLGADYSLVRGDLVRAQVRAHNLYGYGSLSDVNTAGVLVQTAPAQVTGVTVGSATSETQVELSWSALTTAAETGGAAILSYNVEWDAGAADGNWVSLIGYGADSSATTYTVTSGISPGIDFLFRVRAKNMWGWGVYSAITTATPSALPDQMATVTTAVEATAGAVVLAWVAPNDNSSPITAYKIEFQSKDGTTWNEALATCDGSGASVIAALNCTIPMATFTASPFSLVLGDLIVVRASAYNANGWGPTSAVNTGGAYVRTIPTTMNAPTRDASSSDSQIIVNWETLTASAQTGGSTVLSYSLEWAAGTDPTTWSELTGHTVRTLATSFTVTSGLTGGAAYLFRLRAENIYGWGPYSTQTTVYAAGLPSQPAQAVTTIVGTAVRISFTEPDAAAAPITQYKIVVQQSDGTFSEELTSCSATDIVNSATAGDK